MRRRAADIALKHRHLRGCYLLDLFLRWKHTKEWSNKKAEYNKKKKKGSSLLGFDFRGDGGGCVCVCVWGAPEWLFDSCLFLRKRGALIYLFLWQIVDMQSAFALFALRTENSLSPLCYSLFERRRDVARKVNKHFPSLMHRLPLQVMSNADAFPPSRTIPWMKDNKWVNATKCAPHPPSWGCLRINCLSWLSGFKANLPW